MNEHRSRTKEQIFSDMFRELRAWNKEIPASPERMDPILRILMQLYANQLEQIDGRVNRLWDVATSSLVRSVCPDSGRWPVPAHTVIKCNLVDSSTEADVHTRLVYKEQREGGQTFFFAPVRNEKLTSAAVTSALLQSEGNLMPMATAGSTSSSAMNTPVSASGARHIFLVVEWSGLGEDLVDTTVFLRGKPEALSQLQWSHWVPWGAGGFNLPGAFVPGAADTIERMFGEPDGRPRLWGSFRSSGTIFDDLRDNFVVFPESFTSRLKPVTATDPALVDAGLTLPEPSEPGVRQYLFRLDLPPRGDRRALLDGVSIDFGCFVAINASEQTLFKHTAGNRVVDLWLPDPIESVLNIRRVVDSRGNSFMPRYEVKYGEATQTYTIEERNGRLCLWFDFSSRMDTPPESLTVTYAVTNGGAANGIEPEVITELYESHPGIDDVRNVLSVRGAVPAKTEEQIVKEVSTRLRSRDRAVTFADVADWTKTFDRRIQSVECENGVQRTSAGVRRCIVVGIYVSERDFYSDEELELLKERLTSFLKARSSVNVQYQVEVIR